MTECLGAFRFLPLIFQFAACFAINCFSRLCFAETIQIYAVFPVQAQKKKRSEKTEKNVFVKILIRNIYYLYNDFSREIVHNSVETVYNLH